jgi:hypothetical protein
MKAAIALAAVSSVSRVVRMRAVPKKWGQSTPPRSFTNFLDGLQSGVSPAYREEKQRDEAAKATYRALLQAGAPEETAYCK